MLGMYYLDIVQQLNQGHLHSLRVDVFCILEL